MTLPAYLFDPPKKTTETVFVVADFVNLLDTSVTIGSILSVTVARHSGSADASPGSMLIGQALSGTQVSAKLSGGVAGCTYKVTFKIQASDTSTPEIDVLVPVSLERLG